MDEKEFLGVYEKVCFETEVAKNKLRGWYLEHETAIKELLDKETLEYYRDRMYEEGFEIHQTLAERWGLLTKRRFRVRGNEKDS